MELRRKSSSRGLPPAVAAVVAAAVSLPRAVQPAAAAPRRGVLLSAPPTLGAAMPRPACPPQDSLRLCDAIRSAAAEVPTCRRDCRWVLGGTAADWRLGGGQLPARRVPAAAHSPAAQLACEPGARPGLPSPPLPPPQDTGPLCGQGDAGD